MPEHVLVTGAAGFVGRHVVDQLHRSGVHVTALDSLRADVHQHRAPPDLPDDVRLVVGDVRDAEVLAGLLPTVDAIVHLAGKVGLGTSLADLPDYTSSNALGTAVLLAAAAQAGVSTLVLASSMVVYGEGGYRCGEHGPAPAPPRQESDLRAGRFEPACPRCGTAMDPLLVAEDSPMDPRSGYAASKLAQEQLASVWARETGARLVRLRFHNVYGPGLPRDTPYAGVAALFLSSLLAGRAPQVFEDGRQRRDFVHVRDVAGAVRAALDEDRSTATDRAYNVGSGTVTTIHEMASALARAVGGPEPVVTGAYRLGDVRHITASSERLRIELGHRAEVGLDEGVRTLLQAAGPPVATVR